MRLPRPLPAIRFSSAWNFSPTGAGSRAPASRTSTAAAGRSIFDEVEERKLPLLFEAAGNFLDRGPRDPEAWPSSGSSLRSFAGPRRAGWPTTLSTPSCAGNSTPARGPSGPSRCAAASRRLWPRQPNSTAAPSPRNKALQFAFSLQWHQLREAAAQKGIRILGDVAIFVNMDSADVWVHPEIFELDENLKPLRVAGVPPDYFSPTGQRWGNPLYRWDVLAERGFDWWIERIRHACSLYDIVRLDHFRGFEAYWAIPAAEETAVKGEWVKGPGLALFRALEAALGPLPLVAEDLGMITPEVDALRKELGLPGMKVVQFGFGDKGAHIHLPHRYTPDTVAYTGTHDNNTTLGWWQAAGKAERAAIEAYVGPVGKQPGLAADLGHRGQRGADGHRSRAGSARAGRRGPHEYPRRGRGQLELARPGNKLVAGTGRAPGRAGRSHRPRQRSAGQSREIGIRVFVIKREAFLALGISPCQNVFYRCATSFPQHRDP